MLASSATSHGKQRVGAGLVGQRAHPPLQRLPLESEGEIRALRGAGRGDAPSQGTVIGDAHDQAALAAHQVAWNGRRCRSTIRHVFLLLPLSTTVSLGFSWHKAADRARGCARFVPTETLACLALRQQRRDSGTRSALDLILSGA